MLGRHSHIAESHTQAHIILKSERPTVIVLSFFISHLLFIWMYYGRVWC